MVSYARVKSEDATLVASTGPNGAEDKMAPRAADSRIANPGSIVAVVFLISLAIPVFFTLGFIRMSPYRFILVAMFLPLVFSWLSGKCGRIRLADIFLLLFCLWTVIATFANHGLSQTEFAGIFFIEIFGAYLLGRRYVRNLGDFLRVSRVLFFMMLLFIPFAVMEGVWAKQVYAPLFSALGNTIAYTGYDPRLGLDRVQVAFEHPILYGVFCSTTFALLFYYPRKNKPGVSGLRRAWAAVAATFFSLSSGAFVPVVFQTGLMFYNWLMRSYQTRWKIMAAMIAVMYVVIDIGSNRTPAQVFASALAFNSSTYYYRVLIFQYGIQNVWADPLFGFGLFGNWARPSWMVTSTIDNLWLVMAIRYGIPGILLFAAGYVASIVTLVQAKVVSPVAKNQRYAMVFILLSIGIAISTVFLWNATLVYLMFLLGAGSWLADDELEGATTIVRKSPAEKGEVLPSETAEIPPEGRKYSRVKPRSTHDVGD